MEGRIHLFLTQAFSLGVGKMYRDNHSCCKGIEKAQHGMHFYHKGSFSRALCEVKEPPAATR